MALTQRTQLEVVGISYRVPAVAKASQTLFPGALLVADSNGLAAIGADAAGELPIGMYTGQGLVSPFESLVVPSGQNPTIETLKGKIWVPFATAAQTDVGEKFYMSSDDTVTKTAGSKTYYMICEAFKTGFVLLDFNRVQG